MSTLVLGLGNLVHADDGVGIHAIERLRIDPRIPSHVVVMDGGVQGLNLLPHISGFQRLLVIDAVNAGQPPGAVIRLEGPAVDKLPGKPSVHQLGFADLMIALKLLGQSPQEVVVLGVQPESTDWSTELTPRVRSSLDELIARAISQVEAWEIAGQST